MKLFAVDLMILTFSRPSLISLRLLIAPDADGLRNCALDFR